MTSRPAQIIDAFLLFNEIDLLEIRLAELDPVVDKFVIVEADHTFAGRPKPYFFPQWRERFESWADKIVYTPVRLPVSALVQDEAERFRFEAFQRDQIAAAVAALAPDDDAIVMISDVDEIWRAGHARRLREVMRDNDRCILGLRNHRGYINNTASSALNGRTVHAPVACRLDALTRMSVHTIRMAARNPHIPRLADAGWHFSSLGGADAFWIKSQNFSHIEDPHRVTDVPEAEQEIRVLTGPLSRRQCTDIQRKYLEWAIEPAFSPLTYEEFAIEQDVPVALIANKTRYRRFFFFTDCV